MTPEIIYEDDKMLICKKKAGVLAQANRSFDQDMVSALMAYRKRKKEDTYVAVINRLDRPVEGLMVFAKTREEAARLSKLMQKNTFDKTYIAVVIGKLNQQSGVLEDYILKDSKNNISHIVNKGVKDAKYAKLSYEVIKTQEIELADGTNQQVSWVKIQLETGRHHQIRVQFASRGNVLVGDVKYQKNADVDMRMLTKALHISPNTLALCASKLTIGDRHFEVEASFQ